MKSYHDNDSHGIKKLMDHFLRPRSHSAASWHGRSDSAISLDASSRRSSRSRKSPSPSSFHRKVRSIFHPSDADVSLELWNTAYNSLRDSPVSTALVTAYEGIITQELPDDLKLGGGMNSSFGDISNDERLKLMGVITDAGLHKRRASNSSQADEPVRVLLGSSKDMIESVWSEYPSAAVAWSGISTLTPLLLQTILDRVEDIRSGIIHIIGRIPWYTHLSELMISSNWKDDRDFRRQQPHTREYIVTLYRKVLEFQMNCVCAAASTWNHAARNVVGWKDMGSLVESIRDADRQIIEEMERFAKESTKETLLGYSKDLDLQTMDSLVGDAAHGSQSLHGDATGSITGTLDAKPSVTCI
ncbi:hypothetical protein PT974_01801 [Cladobotryum mycophilum]|uniref:NWD NACHT-NTPase N-terminal domain-containing protein n=1 Tax=Cladobotryum mycophilum TaxID=491253 RepID=A0ABR0SX43_9HYPO